MSLVSDLKSWLWILKIWIPLYPLLLIIGIVVGTFVSPIFYWSVFLIGVPLAVIPLTYWNLVGGGCSLRFQMCAVAKGMLAGFFFLSLSLIADPIVWQVLSSGVGWNPLSLSMAQDFNFIWFFSAAVGGFGARIVEVRGQSQSSKITIAGFE
jgi:hypothetical protein